MASSKEYAYYLKGNKLALVQKDLVFSSGQTLSQPGLNDLAVSGRLLWKSPKESIADGLEIQYAYSPEYTVESSTAKYTTLVDWNAHSTGNYLVIRGATNYDTKLDVGHYFLLRKAGKWNGIHQVQSFGAVTYDASSYTSGVINTYTVTDGDPASTTLFEETPELYYDVNVLNDEDDTIPLPEYLCKAVVYYVRAKYAEDSGQIDMKEYFMREFRALTEKFHAGKQKGPFKVQSLSML